MEAPRIKPAIALTEAEERDAYPHPGRRLSKYEILNQPDREKPLPRVPVPIRGQSPRAQRRLSPIRIPSQRRGHSFSHTPGGLISPPFLPKLHPRAASDTPMPSASMHSLNTAPSPPMKTDIKVSSFSRGASGCRSSKKINQLIGHDLDLVDPRGVQTRASFGSIAEYSEGASSSNSGSSSDSENDDDDDDDDDDDVQGGCFINVEDGLLPLLLDVDDEGGLSPGREHAWEPRLAPPPLSVHRHGQSSSVGYPSIASSEHSPTYDKAFNFSLSSELPTRWNSVYGQFADKRAAADYHRFAAELATPYEREKSPAAPPPSPERHAGHVGQTRAANIIGFWDNARPKDAGSPLPPLLPPRSPFAGIVRATSPALSFRGNTLKKPPPLRLTVKPPCPSLQKSLLIVTSPLSASPSSPVPPTPATPCSAFDYDSDDDDEGGGRSTPRRWWRRSDDDDYDEERRSSGESPFVPWLKRQEDDREKTLFGGGVRGMFTSARERTLFSPAERRRVDLRKSIRVLRVPELGKD